MTAVDAGQPGEHLPGDRLSQVAEACLLIASKPGLNEVLQTVADEARSITGARFCSVRIQEPSALSVDLITSGINLEEDIPAGTVPESHAHSGGNATQAYHPGTESGGAASRLESAPQSRNWLEIPIVLHGETFGFISLVAKENEEEFSPEDKESLGMLSSIATMAIANAQSYWAKQRAKADLKALIDTYPVGVLVFDAETGELVSASEKINHLAEELCIPGFSLDQLLGILKYRRADGREISLAEIPLIQVLNSGETVRAEEINIEVPGGPRLTALLNATPIRSEDDRVLSVVITLQDVAPQREVHRIRAEFLGTVSHELRTPLTTIKGSAATLLGASPPLDPGETRQFFHIIDQQADYMRDLITNLLDLSRLEAGTLHIVPQAVDLEELLHEARNDFLKRTVKHDIVVQLEQSLPSVWADRQRVSQVVNHMLSMVSKNSIEPSVVNVTAHQEDVYIEVLVECEAKGASAEGTSLRSMYLSGIDGEHDAPGHGLSLAVCKGIIESHGGRIWVEPGTQEHGSKFTFALPIVNATTYDGNIDLTSGFDNSENRPSVGVRILVIDNDLKTLGYVRKSLMDAGYDPIVTSDLDSVDRLVEAMHPQLVLLDLALPGDGGSELIERIPKALDVPVIFLSERGRGQDIARAFELGGDDCIVKPFMPTELVARVKAALRKQASYNQVRPIEPYQVGELTLNYAERRVTMGDQTAQLTATEYKLLFELSISTGRVLTHDQLLRRVWGSGYTGDARIVRAFIKSLRRKLGDDANHPRFIFTEPRVGYRMAKPEP
jgi:two-component system KDP operon response regulator KdpE